ncbi:response regulator [bacterium]|nr:response regulator [bacterium]
MEFYLECNAIEKHRTILIVDDNEANFDIILGVFEDCNYDLLVALDGQSAFDIVLAGDVDLILLDIMMPGMDGFQTCQKLKKGLLVNKGRGQA